MDDWLLVLIVLIIGFVVGLILSRLLHALATNPKQPEPIRSVAKPISNFGLAVGLVTGMIVALGIVDPASLEQLPKDLIAFVPKVLVAAIIVIMASVLAGFASAAIYQAMGQMASSLVRQVELIVKATIFTLATLLAVGELGIDTEVVNLGIAAIFFSIAASLTLLVGLGGIGVAREVASGRALKRLIKLGDTISIDDVSGVIQAIHPTAVEISDHSDQRLFIPPSKFLNQNVTIHRSETNS